MLPTKLYAKPGDRILPKFNELLHWIRSQRVVPHERIRIAETAQGTIVHVEDRPVIVPTPLQVKVEQDEKYFTVSDGNVNEESPWYYDFIEGKYLQVRPYITKYGRRIKMPDHKKDEEVYFFVVTRFISKDFLMTEFSVYHNSIEAFNKPMLLAQKIAMKDISRGIPYANTGIAGAAPCKGEFYTPLAMLKDSILHQFTRHNLSNRVYLDGERKRMAYWPA